MIDLLKKIGLLGCKSVETPIKANRNIRDINEDLTEETFREWWGNSFISHTPNMNCICI